MKNSLRGMKATEHSCNQRLGCISDNWQWLKRLSTIKREKVKRLQGQAEAFCPVCLGGGFTPVAPQSAQSIGFLGGGFTPVDP
eukprot:12932288-Prorocentrum_lima.AAC.1